MDGHDQADLDGDSEWDEFYSARTQVWSGNPNHALVAEVADLPPGRALDVGCGEGGDAIWLALRGWDVTALDVSDVALARAAASAQKSEVEVRWLRAGLLEARLDPRSFDLVSAQYPGLRHTSGALAERALLNAVSVGGTLLVVHHADFGAHEHAEHGFDPASFVAVEDVHAMLGDDWEVEVYGQRQRHVPSGAGAGHTHDMVLRARRR
jgi:SAM-dependent methyltransferase